MSWLLWLRVVLVTALLIPFVQLSTRLWALKARPAGRRLRLIESIGLGGEARLHLVEVAGRVYLVSSGPQGSQVIDHLPPEVLSAVEAGEGVRGQDDLWGADLLEQMLGPTLAAGVRRGLAAVRQALSTVTGRAAKLPSSLQGAAGESNPALVALEQQLARVRRLEMGTR
ncbi:MAG: flagellar biosynthetic protein FliO [Chitinophagales bacterium]